MTKKNNWDIVCPEYISYVAIKTMVDTILSQPKQKNQIEIAQISVGDNEVEGEGDANANFQKDELYEEYEE